MGGRAWSLVVVAAVIGVAGLALLVIPYSGNATQSPPPGLGDPSGVAAVSGKVTTHTECVAPIVELVTDPAPRMKSPALGKDGLFVVGRMENLRPYCETTARYRSALGVAFLVIAGLLVLIAKPRRASKEPAPPEAAVTSSP
jgi:hypothetical protein